MKRTKLEISIAINGANFYVMVRNDTSDRETLDTNNKFAIYSFVTSQIKRAMEAAT